MASFTFLGRLGRLLERFGGGCALIARGAHLFLGAMRNALLFGVNVGIKPRFRCHYDPIHEVATAPRSLYARVLSFAVYSL